MIFVTIGTQEPFDRLIKVMDELAGEFKDIKVIAQVSANSYKVQHMEAKGFFPPEEFDGVFEKAKIIVSHAGMGTIISALQKGKQIIVLPRKVDLKEHRNDHQMATAKKMELLQYVHVVYDEKLLKSKILELLNNSDQTALHSVSEFASPDLILSLKNFINQV